MKKVLINEAPGYILYENGDIFSLKSNKFITKRIHTNGYYIVELTVEKYKRKKFYIHRLLALYFIPNDNPEYKTCVNHKDENKLNNDLTNLEWISNNNNLNYGTAQKRSSEKRKRKVDMLDGINGKIIKTFNSLTEACEYIKRSPGTLIPALKNKYKTCGGKYWKYHDDLC